MIEQFEKVKYIGHQDGCLSCGANPQHPDWVNRIGKVALYIGTEGRHDGAVKVHFEGEEYPVFCYRSHLAQA